MRILIALLFLTSCSGFNIENGRTPASEFRNEKLASMSCIELLRLLRKKTSFTGSGDVWDMGFLNDGGKLYYPILGTRPVDTIGWFKKDGISMDEAIELTGLSEKTLIAYLDDLKKVKEVSDYEIREGRVLLKQAQKFVDDEEEELEALFSAMSPSTLGNYNISINEIVRSTGHSFEFIETLAADSPFYRVVIYDNKKYVEINSQYAYDERPEDLVYKVARSFSNTWVSLEEVASKSQLPIDVIKKIIVDNPFVFEKSVTSDNQAIFKIVSKSFKPSVTNQAIKFEAKRELWLRIGRTLYPFIDWESRFFK